MTTAEEILDWFLRDLHWPYNSKANAIKAMEEYAQLKLSEHSTKEQWISVEDRLPECGIEVETDGKDGRQIAEWHHNHHNQIEWFVSFAKRDDVTIYTPTRWRPLIK